MYQPSCPRFTGQTPVGRMHQQSDTHTFAAFRAVVDIASRAIATRNSSVFGRRAFARGVAAAVVVLARVICSVHMFA